MEQLERKPRKTDTKNEISLVLMAFLLIIALLILAVFYFTKDKNSAKPTHIATYNFNLGLWPEGCSGTATINKKENVWSLQFDEINQNFLSEPINEYSHIKIKIYYSGFFVIGDYSLFTDTDVFTIEALDNQNQTLKSYSFSYVSIDEATVVTIKQNNMNRLKLTLTNYANMDGQNLFASNVLISKIELDSIV